MQDDPMLEREVNKIQEFPPSPKPPLRIVEEMEDGRPISGLRTASRYVTGDEIVPYEERGEMAYVTWFAIYRNFQIVSRVNARHVVEVDYAPPPRTTEEA